MDQQARKILWYAFGQCWVDHPLEDTDFYRHLAHLDQHLHQQGGGQPTPINDLEREVKNAICLGFARHSLAAFFSAGMSLQSWFMAEEEIDEIRVQYETRCRLCVFINPLLWLGLWYSRYLVGDALAAMKKTLAQHKHRSTPS